MKNLAQLFVILIFAATIVSCGSTVAKVKQKKELAGYTLKNKQELMQQKIVSSKKNKTVVAAP
jgi:hypothetical protein